MRVKPRAGRRAQDNLSQRLIWILPRSDVTVLAITITRQALTPRIPTQPTQSR